MLKVISPDFHMVLSFLPPNLRLPMIKGQPINLPHEIRVIDGQIQTLHVLFPVPMPHKGVGYERMQAVFHRVGLPAVPETAIPDGVFRLTRTNSWAIMSQYRHGAEEERGAAFGVEVDMSDLDEALKHILSLDVPDRAAPAERLLASLEDLPEEEADRFWAEEARRRLDAYRAGRGRTASAEEVRDKAEKLLR